MQGISPVKYSLFPLILSALGGLALLAPRSSFLAAALGIAYLAASAELAGRRLFSDERAPWRQLLGGVVLAVTLILVGGTAYYAHDLAPPVITGIVLLLPFVFAFAPRQSRDGAMFAHGGEIGFDGELALRVGAVEAEEDGKVVSIVSGDSMLFRRVLRMLGIFALTACIMMIVHALIVASGSATDVAIRTPWDAVSPAILAPLAIAALGVFVVAASGIAGTAALIPMTALLFAMTGIAALVYSIGYGFDPFIHRATEAAILADGGISPKPLYYVGQYAFITLLARITGAGVHGIDLWLVPTAMALILPIAYWSVRRALRWDAPTALTACFVLYLLPLSPFVATTPQGFANVLLLAIAFLALPTVQGDAFPKVLLLLLGAAAALVHPLAGIPVLLFLAVLLFVIDIAPRLRWNARAKDRALAVIVAFGCMAIPATFLLLSAVSDTPARFTAGPLLSDPVGLLRELRGTSDISTRQFHAALDLTYAWQMWRMPLLLLAGGAGVALLSRTRRELADAYGASALVALGNYALLKAFIDFPFLIDYERSAYADRLPDLAAYLLAPAIVVAAGVAWRRMWRGTASMRVATAVLVAFAVTASAYLAYPRRDAYESSRGWSVGAPDVAVVRLIAEQAGGEPYIVLANQSVSAAAIREYGFAQYFPGDVFYYPVPTGGPLYARFLAMNDCSGCVSEAHAAMDLAGTNLAFFAVNHYWHRANAIVANAKREADAWWSVDDRVWVFQYER